jgi:hypothetical protein
VLDVMRSTKGSRNGVDKRVLQQFQVTFQLRWMGEKRRERKEGRWLWRESIARLPTPSGPCFIHSIAAPLFLFPLGVASCLGCHQHRQVGWRAGPRPCVPGADEGEGLPARSTGKRAARANASAATGVPVTGEEMRGGRSLRSRGGDAHHRWRRGVAGAVMPP